MNIYIFNTSPIKIAVACITQKAHERDHPFEETSDRRLFKRSLNYLTFSSIFAGECSSRSLLLCDIGIIKNRLTGIRRRVTGFSELLEFCRDSGVQIPLRTQIQYLSNNQEVVDFLRETINENVARSLQMSLPSGIELLIDDSNR